MLLFLMGVGLFELAVSLLLLSAVGVVVYRITKKALQRMLPQSGRKVKYLSLISAFILSPVLVFGFLAMLFYVLAS